MGRYKRAKGKVKVEKPFVSTKMVIDFINENWNQLNALPKNVFKITKEHIEDSGHNWSEIGTEYRLRFSENIFYIVSCITRVDDYNEVDGGGQSDSHKMLDCFTKDYKNVEPRIILELLKNFIKMKTELAQKLKEILDDMTQEDFDQEWEEITALNMDSPTIQEMNDWIDEQK